MKHVNTITLRVGDYYYEANLDAFGDGECCCNISWYSENPDIASVNPSGLAICGMSEGTTRICASVGNGEIYYLTVIVSGQIEVTGIHLNYTSKTLKIGDTFTLTAAVHPAYATNTNLIWTNTNPNVATFEDGVVTAIASAR